MTGKINEIHDTEPIGTIRVALNRAISGAQCVYGGIALASGGEKGFLPEGM